MEMGYRIGCLLNFTSTRHRRSCFHGIPRELMDLQAGLIGIPLLQHEVGDMELYEREFRRAASALKGQDIEAIVFGDIYLEGQENWVERVCGDLGITAIEPLWQRSPEGIMEEFIRSGFKAVVTSAKAELFDRHFVGREVDGVLLRELKERGICPCGEGGEFHTLVVDGPLFRGGGIEITDSRAVLIEGFWPHWSLDIQGWRVRENSRS
jgi:uncharacterized protein (TIGR00290 family)